MSIPKKKEIGYVVITFISFFRYFYGNQKSRSKKHMNVFLSLSSVLHILIIAPTKR